jgi:hypothetical protein
MIPHTIVLEPGLVIYKIYTSYGFFCRPMVEDLRYDVRAVTKKVCVPLPTNAGRIGTSQLLNSKQHGNKAGRNCFTPAAKRLSKLLVNRVRSGIAVSCRSSFLS